jgi:hypothetical protein
MFAHGGREVKRDPDNLPRMPRLPIIAPLAAWLALAGCGSDGEEPQEPASPVPGGADPAAVEVIEDWSSTLREGDVEGAAELFAIPSEAQNGPTHIEISDRADAVSFNESLPCGAKLERAVDHAGVVIATFRLTERPGPGRCGAGTGELARTAFRIAGGEIVEWLRVPTSAEPSPPADVV